MTKMGSGADRQGKQEILGKLEAIATAALAARMTAALADADAPMPAVGSARIKILRRLAVLARELDDAQVAVERAEMVAKLSHVERQLAHCTRSAVEDAIGTAIRDLVDSYHGDREQPEGEGTQ